jgi:hypothetical protein
VSKLIFTCLSDVTMFWIAMPLSLKRVSSLIKDTSYKLGLWSSSCASLVWAANTCYSSARTPLTYNSYIPCY